MPVVTVTLIEGYDAATREALMRRLTQAVRATIAAPLDGTTIVDQRGRAGLLHARRRRGAEARRAGTGRDRHRARVPGGNGGARHGEGGASSWRPASR